jgi:hypothetical protein
MVRHWIRPRSSSHMNNWTLGGAEFCQINVALASFGWPFAFSNW